MRFSDPCRRKMARKRKFLSPITRADTTKVFLVIRWDDCSPQVRRLHDTRASSTTRPGTPQGGGSATRAAAA